MKTRIGYIRLSRKDAKSLSIQNQKKALLKYDSTMKIFIDEGVSGSINLTDQDSQWNKGVMPLFYKDPANTEIVVYTYDRLGRKKGKVLSVIEDITDLGGQIHTIRDNKTFTDAEAFDQAVEMTFRSITDESYRVEVTKKTQKALDTLSKAGVKLGRKPVLTEKHIAEIKDLYERGLGYASIGKVVRTKNQSSGKLTNTSPRTVKAVIEGTYTSREEWERLNQIARLSMLGGRK